jgi:hypothetical protein
MTQASETASTKIIARLMRAFYWCIICVGVWSVAWVFAAIAASSAKDSPEPNPELGRVVYIDAVLAMGRGGNWQVSGYVKPWVAYFYNFTVMCGWTLLIVAVCVTAAMLITRSITGEWPKWPEN